MEFAIVSAYVYAIASIFHLDHSSARNVTANFVCSQINKMPVVLRTGVLVLLLLSATFCFIKYLRLPQSLNLNDRKAFVLSLKSSAFGPFRDLGQLLFSFSAMGLYSFDQRFN